MSRITETLRHEVKAVIPPTIFFMVSFHILALFRSLMLRQYGVHVSSLAGATIGALLVAKVVLVADKLPFVNRFPEKPLIYNVCWKTAIYFVAAFIVRYLEHFIPIWWQLRDVGKASHELLRLVIWPHFWAIQLWLLVLLFLYCAARELVRAIGPDETRRMFFGPPRARNTGSLEGGIVTRMRT